MGFPQPLLPELSDAAKATYWRWSGMSWRQSGHQGCDYTIWVFDPG